MGGCQCAGESEKKVEVAFDKLPKLQSRSVEKKPTIVYHAGGTAVLGESPLWHVKRQKFYWLDIMGDGNVFSLSIPMSGNIGLCKVQTHPGCDTISKGLTEPLRISAWAPREHGEGFIVSTTRHGFATLDVLDGGQVTNPVFINNPINNQDFEGTG